MSPSHQRERYIFTHSRSLFVNQTHAQAIAAEFRRCGFAVRHHIEVADSSYELYTSAERTIIYPTLGWAALHSEDAASRIVSARRQIELTPQQTYQVEVGSSGWGYILAQWHHPLAQLPEQA